VAVVLGLLGMNGMAAEGGGTLQFSQPLYSVKEDAASVTITVNRLAGTAGTATVDFRTESQNATADLDYIPTNGTLVFLPGVAKATFKVFIVPDTMNEASEAVTLILENATGALMGGQDNSTLNIVDNDPCAYSLTPSSRTHSPSAGVSNVAVTATAGCSWVASANVSWIGVFAGQGSGNGEVQYSLDTNTATVARSGRITVAGKVFTLTQQGAPLPDVVKPVVTILQPAAGVRLTNTTTATVSGRAVDVRGVASVEYRVENYTGTNEYQIAEGTTNWTVQVEGLVTGTNTVRVRAHDDSGNVSLEVTRPVIAMAASPLVVQLSGNGLVAPMLNGQSLEVGRTYTMTATPRPRNFFVGWTGGIQTNAARLMFQMQTNLSVQANFVTNPFIAVKGSYNGLFRETLGVRHESSGFFNATTTDAGSFTARLVLAGKPVSFSGRFGLDGKSTNTLQRAGFNPLTVWLSLDVETGSDQIAGTISDGNWTADLRADRAGMAGAMGLNGRYTLIILGGTNSASTPGGASFGTVTVVAGAASLNGTLADGTPITQKAPLSRFGDWPLYVPLHGGKGSMFSRMLFAEQPGDDLGGALTWSKPALATAKYYSNRFVLNTVVSGSRYQPPTNATDLLLDFPGGGLAGFSGGDLVESFTNHVVLTNGNRVINLGSNNLVTTIVRPSGLFNGIVRDPNSTRTLPFKGAIHKKGQFGAGFFLGTNQSGQVFLQEAP